MTVLRNLELGSYLCKGKHEMARELGKTLVLGGDLDA